MSSDMEEIAFEAIDGEKTKRQSRKIKFTPQSIASLKTLARKTGERQERSDIDQRGFYVRAYPNGDVIWLLTKKVGRTITRVEVGRYPAKPIGKAREAAIKELAAIAENRSERRKAHAIKRARKAAAAGQGGTLRAMIMQERTDYPRKYADWDATIGKVNRVFGELLDEPYGALSSDILATRATEYHKRSAVVAHNGANCLKAFLNRSPIKEVRMLADFPSPEYKGEGERVLSDAELRLYIPLLRHHPAPTFGLGLLWILYTGCRLMEMAKARWADVNRKTGVWTIPQENVKTDNQHWLKLPRQALQILDLLGWGDPEAVIFASKYVDVRSDAAWSALTIRMIKEQKGERWHRHDLRRTAATLMGCLLIEPEIIKAMLNHEHITNQLESRYNKARYRLKVQWALQKLADAIDEILLGMNRDEIEEMAIEEEMEMEQIAIERRREMLARAAEAAALRAAQCSTVSPV